MTPDDAGVRGQAPRPFAAHQGGADIADANERQAVGAGIVLSDGHRAAAGASHGVVQLAKQALRLTERVAGKLLGPGLGGSLGLLTVTQTIYKQCAQSLLTQGHVPSITTGGVIMQ